jgi:hypothetical protein
MSGSKASIKLVSNKLLETGKVPGVELLEGITDVGLRIEK